MAFCIIFMKQNDSVLLWLCNYIKRQHLFFLTASADSQHLCRKEYFSQLFRD